MTLWAVLLLLLFGFLWVYGTIKKWNGFLLIVFGLVFFAMFVATGYADDFSRWMFGLVDDTQNVRVEQVG